MGRRQTRTDAVRREPLVLTEYQTSTPTRLTLSERDGLRDLLPDLTIQPAAGSTDTYLLRPGSTVGVVRVDDLTVELRPKVGVTNTLFLVSYALDPSAWRPPRAELPPADLAEAVVPLFSSAVQTAIGRGLLHGYRHRDDTLVTIRGRIRMSDQLAARAGLPLPVEVSYDEYTPDIPENQLLRTAVDILGRLRLRAATSRTALARLHQHLAGIDTIHTRHITQPVWTRLNQHYRPAVALAQLIIGNTGLQARAGTIDATAFLVDMNAIFENFTHAALREALHLDKPSFPPGAASHTLHLDRERTIRLEPDLTWWQGGRCIFTGDCKYKQPAPRIPNQDIYQMLAYLTALRLPAGLLIYTGEGDPADITIAASGHRIHIRALDITRTPSEILTQITQLARTIDELTHTDQTANGIDGRSL